MASYIKKVIERKTPVTVFLTNGVKLQGVITDIETEPVLSYVLNRDGHTQLIHLHAVSTVMPNALPGMMP